MSEVRRGATAVGYEHLSQILMSLVEPEAMYESSELKHTVLREHTHRRGRRREEEGRGGRREEGGGRREEGGGRREEGGGE